MPEFVVHPYHPAYLPSGFDRADGLGSRLGLATPSGAIQLNDSSGTYDTVSDTLYPQELEDSPTIERAEQATITHTYRCGWDIGKQLIEFYGRGVIWQDSQGRLTKVLSSNLQHGKGDVCLLTIVSEGISFDTPPDHFSVVPVELGINIIKHPRYFYAFMGTSSTEEKLNQMVIRMLQNYFDNTTFAYRDGISKMIYASLDNLGTTSDPNPVGGETEGGIFKWEGGSPANDYLGTVRIPGTNMAKRAALEIIQKYWRNTETPYIIGYQLTWAQYFWVPQYLNPGGYIEDPVTGGLPDYFWNPLTGGSIFSMMAQYNPQCYSTNGYPNGDFEISWLRKADEVEWERTWFRITKTWMGSAIGFWDTELFAASHRPTNPGHYLQINPN